MKKERRTFLTLLAAAGLSASGLAACGRKGDLRPPEGEKAAYKYPRQYPAPSSVIPETVTAPQTEEGTEEERRLEPRKEDKLSPFPLSPERSRTYGS